MAEVTYRISEVFTSVQGEGPEVGVRATFVRFSGCNLACPFCDEPGRHGGAPFTAAAILSMIQGSYAGVPPDRVILTGGEPLLQVDRALVKAFAHEHLDYSIETNGSSALEGNDDLEQVLEEAQSIVVSPKAPQVTLARPIREPSQAVRARLCFKVVVPLHGGTSLDDLRYYATLAAPGRLFLQPVTPHAWRSGEGAAELERNALAATRVQWALAPARGQMGSRWRILPQTHVWLGYR